MNLAAAKKIADAIVARLSPLCRRIEIAGSIRRQRTEVGDIDLVILTGDIPSVKQRCTERCQIVVNGDQNFIVRMPTGLQLDIYFARGPVSDLLAPQPSNWPSLLLLRTGSREHNIFLIERAKKMGITWKPQIGVLDPDGYVISGDTEESIYNQLALPIIPPTLREVTYMEEHFGSRKVGRVAPCAPLSAQLPDGAHGVTRPTTTPAGLAALAELHAFGETLLS